MNEIIRAMEERRSIRNFKPEMPPKEVLQQIVEAAHALGLGSIWIHRAKEEFEEPEYQQLLKDLGVEGEWEGIGHCAVGYLNGEAPAPAPRKPGRVFWAE